MTTDKPHDMDPETVDKNDLGDETHITWWRPGWGDVAATAGWWMVGLTAAMAVLAVAAAVLLIVAGLAFSAVLIKPALVLGGGAVVLVGYLVRKGISARHEPFCIYCGYCLTGLADGHRCPECGRTCTRREIDDYRRDPEWFKERWAARRALPPADPPVDTGPPRPRQKPRDGTG